MMWFLTDGQKQLQPWTISVLVASHEKNLIAYRRMSINKCKSFQENFHEREGATDNCYVAKIEQ